MKLAEALILRADLKKRIEQLRDRLRRNVRVQEGDQPAERPEALLEEFERTAGELQVLIRQVNAVNARAPFDGELRISDAIAVRDGLDLRIRTIREVLAAATERDRLYTRSEIKFVAVLDAAALQRQLDDLSRKRRELDTRLQMTNWQVDLT